MKKVILLLSLFVILLFIPNISSDGNIPKILQIEMKALQIDMMLYQEELNLPNILNIRELVLYDKSLLNSVIVDVTAYNSVESQTDDTPNICAWNDKIRPNIIAVSRDLLKIGLNRNTKVYIENIGTKVVLDKMNERYTKRIDIYFGGKEKIKEAQKFSKRKCRIYWRNNGRIK